MPGVVDTGLEKLAPATFPSSSCSGLGDFGRKGLAYPCMVDDDGEGGVCPTGVAAPEAAAAAVAAAAAAAAALALDERRLFTGGFGFCAVGAAGAAPGGGGGGPMLPECIAYPG